MKLGAKSIEDMQSNSGTHFLGRFQNGQVVGHFWIGLINNGYIQGIADENGKATGDDIAFIYPDGETALKGHFEDRYMRKARSVMVKQYGCDENGMFIAKEFSEPLNDHEYFYDPPTNESFGGGSKYIPDPYEEKTVYMGPSSVPESGEGVLLKRDIPKHRISCFYSLYLYRIPDQVHNYNKKYAYNTSKSDDYRRGCFKYTIGLNSYQGHIDLPPEFDINPLPTLGPKVNHHFRMNNSGTLFNQHDSFFGLISDFLFLVYSEAEHPRFGLIQAVLPTQNLKAGTELFTHYLYPNKRNEFPSDFPWYYELQEKLESEEKQNEKLSKRKKSKVKPKRKDKSP